MLGLPYGITVGPDGNLWFTKQGGGIGRITPAGVLTLFAAGTNPYGIVAGPDGNLWFTDIALGQIGRITPSGTVTMFSAGISPGAMPRGIAVGPDGNLWFTNFSPMADEIGRITPSGIVTMFSAGITPGSFPRNIAAGPDGNLWFTEQYGNQIGRITPTGVVTEFSSGTTPGQPYGIAAGPDGKLWVGDWTADLIRRILPVATVPAVQATPSTRDFGAETIGGAAVTQVFELSNTGDEVLNLAGVELTGANADQFALATGTTCTASSVIAPGSSCDVAVRFQPTTIGIQSASVKLIDDAAGSPQAIALTGTALPSPPTVATGAATMIRSDSATLTGLVTPNGTPTTYRFDYGTTAAYGSSTAARDAGSGTVGVTASAGLSGLQPATTYHFRLVTTNAGGISHGSDGTFTTVAAPVGVVEPPPSAGVQLPAPPSVLPAPGKVSITSQPDALASSRSARITFTAAGQLAGFQCRLDNGPWVACAAPFTLNGLHSGDHGISVRAVNAAGITGPAAVSRRFQVNVYPPGIAIRNPATIAVNRTGTARVRILCSPREGAGRGACSGTVRLRAARDGSPGALLGQGAFAARAGKIATVPIALTDSARQQLAAAPARRLRIDVRLSVQDLAANHATLTARRTLQFVKPPRSG
ncbi:MAG: putative antibiotic hydrolase [Conexibacter sp.]|nr:putative antibiotic hydrolase [Conexibacter sp.]